MCLLFQVAVILPTAKLFRCTQGFYSGYPPLYSNKNMGIWNDCFIGIFILYIVLHCPISYYILRLFFFLTLKSTISAIPPLFISLILNSFRSSKPNTSFCGTSAAVVVSTARMVISANDISVTWYSLSTTLMYLICVILSVIKITSVSIASPNKEMLYGFWTNLSIHVLRGESAWFVRLEEPFVLKRTYERLVQTNRPMWLIMCFQNWKRPQFRGHWQLPWIRE